MKKVTIRGLGDYLPQKVRNKDLEPILSPKAVKVLSQTVDIHERYYAVDLKTGAIHLKISDLAAYAGKNALKNAQIEAEQVDLVILSTCTPNYSIPAAVTFVLDELGIENCANIEIRAGCTGFGQAMSVAGQFIQNGKYDTVLVIGCELTSTSLIPFLTEPAIIKKCRLGDLLNFLMFGDAAGAVVLQSSDKEENLIETCIGTVGFNQKPGLILPGPYEALISDAPTVVERFRALCHHDYTLTIQNLRRMGEKAISHILETAGIGIEDVDKFVIPLETPQVIEAVAARFNIPSHRIFTLASKTGQIANAAIPVTLAELHRREVIKPGEKVVLITGENTKWTYASVLLSWPDLDPYTEPNGVDAELISFEGKDDSV